MNYNIKGTGLQVSDELRSYAERQLAHADKLVGDDPTALANVELEYQELRHGEHYRAEFTLVCAGATYRAEVWGATMHEAIDLAGAELMGALRQSKKKRLHVLRRTGAAVKDYLRGWRSKV